MYLRQNNLSVALFAPGWIAETMPYRDIVVNSLRYVIFSIIAYLFRCIDCLFLAAFFFVTFILFPRRKKMHFNWSISLFYLQKLLKETYPSEIYWLNNFKFLVRFWDRLIAFIRPHPLTKLPIDTDFNFGYKCKDACKVSFAITLNCRWFFFDSLPYLLHKNVHFYSNAFLVTQI